MADKDNIIPIGKYKGQPLEVLQGDPAYADWLTAQPWFRERYAGIFQIIVNNFREPAETPEHNRLQARFLDQAFCRALLMRIGSPRILPYVGWKLSARFEVDGWDVVIHGTNEDRTPILATVEIKPTLADDFPAVLRQIKAQRTRRTADGSPAAYLPVLVIDRFDATGATLDQVRQMFGFPIVTIAEIEAALG